MRTHYCTQMSGLNDWINILSSTANPSLSLTHISKIEDLNLHSREVYQTIIPSAYFISRRCKSELSGVQAIPYLYTAIAPVPLSAFAGEPSQSVGKSFIKSYSAVCLEGAIIVLACIIFSLFAAAPPVVNPDAAAVTMVWSYEGELIFNMLILVGAVKMADRAVREMMGL